MALPLDSQVIELVSYKSCLVYQQNDPFFPKVLLDLFLSLAAISRAPFELHSQQSGFVRILVAIYRHVLLVYA